MSAEESSEAVCSWKFTATSFEPEEAAAKIQEAYTTHVLVFLHHIY